MSTLGTVDYGNVTGDITAITFRDGCFHLTIQVEMPHPRFDAHHFRVIDPDGNLVLVKDEDIDSMWQPARDWGGSTWLEQPVAVAAPGGNVNALGPPRAPDWRREDDDC